MTCDDVIRKLSELRKIRDSLLVEIQYIQDTECDHNWLEVSHYTDHDGWSTFSTITFYNNYRCSICDKLRTDTTTGY